MSGMPCLSPKAVSVTDSACNDIQPLETVPQNNGTPATQEF